FFKPVDHVVDDLGDRAADGHGVIEFEFHRLVPGPGWGRIKRAGKGQRQGFRKSALHGFFLSRSKSKGRARQRFARGVKDMLMRVFPVKPDAGAGVSAQMAGGLYGNSAVGADFANDNGVRTEILHVLDGGWEAAVVMDGYMLWPQAYL